MKILPRTTLFHSFCFIVIFSFIWPTLAPAANRGLSVPSNQLPRELKRTDIRDYYAGSGTKQVGAIQTVVGHVVVAREGLRSAYYAAPGDKIFEKDIIFTLKSSKCRYKLIGEDVVMMGENARMGIKNFQTNRQQSTKSSVLTMARGKAMFYALRLFKHRSNSMVVETPTAVSGVRGTKWGVEVVELGGKETASLPIETADTSNLGYRMLAQANPPSPPQFQTTILCFSGTVFTGSTAPPPPGAPPPPVITLVQGQMTTVGSGAPPAPPTVTPLSLVNSFTAGTFAPPPGDSGAPPPAPPPPGTLPPPPPPPPAPPPDNSGLVQQQTQQQTKADPVQNPRTNFSGMDAGYIALMMTNKSRLTLEEIFASYTRQSGSENVWALGHKNTLTDYIRAWGEGGSGSTPYLKWAVFNSGAANTGDLGSSYPITDMELVKYSYLTMSYFTMPLTVSTGGGTYTQDNNGYAVFGYNTPSLPGMGAGSYFGIAYGTYWTSTGGIDMTGSFAAQVDFGSRTITSYTMGVSGAGRYATISNATGSIGNDGHFDIAGGTWVLNSNILASTDYTTAHGSFYGPGAEYMGGNWAMLNKATGEGAVGIYGGSGSVQSRPLTHDGLFVGMLTNTSGTSYQETYISNDSAYTNFDAQQAKAYNSSDYVRVCTTQMHELMASGYPVSSGMPKSLQKAELGYNAYMEWGYWTQPVAMNNSIYDSAFDNKGYYVWGDRTSSLPSSFSGTFSGPAWGTVWSSAGGQDLTGSFSMTVSYAAPTGNITSFSAIVGSGATKTGIENASGTFTGSGLYSVSGGTAYINNDSATATGQAYGAFYGPNAKLTGGVWKVDKTAAPANANGLFIGSRP